MADIKNEVLYRVYGVLALIVLLAVILFGQVVKIQIAEGDKWRRQGDKQVKFEKVIAERGNILSEDGKLLATSLPFFEIRMDLNSTGMKEEDFNNNIDSLAYCLATYVDTENTVGGYRNLLINQRAAGARNMLIKKNVTYTELEKIEKFPLFNLGQFGGGFIVKRQSKRDRPFKMLANRTIGSVREGANKVGLEGFFDEDLGGTAGKKLMQNVGNDIWIPVNNLTEIEPENGHDLLTTINVELQETAQTALVRSINYHDADHGCAVVMDVKTGAIRAIANVGRLKKEKGNLWETYNHAVGDAVEPGSTFKLAPMMALLDKGIISLEDSIDLEEGRTTFYEEIMEDSSPHGLTKATVRRAFELSSNVGIAKMVEAGFGDDGGAIEFINQLRKYNLHLPTGIQIEGEAPPFIKEAYNKEMEWSGITLPWMSIGYEVLITPLQLLTFYNAVANDGQMMRPYLVSEIQDFGVTTRKYKPTVIKRNIAKPETIARAKSLLEGVVKNGTARKLDTDRYNFAGKTGTAQIDYRKFNRRKANLKHRASFVGYFPAENPVYSCIVMITNPKENGIYGADVAGPVFREIADKCFATRIEMHRGINSYAKPKLVDYELPTMNIGKKDAVKYLMDYFKLPHENRAESNWTVLQPERDTVTLLSRDVTASIIPNVKGMTMMDAVYVLENLGLNVIATGVGKVHYQSITAGTKARNQTIKIKLN